MPIGTNAAKVHFYWRRVFWSIILVTMMLRMALHVHSGLRVVSGHTGKYLNESVGILILGTSYKTLIPVGTELPASVQPTVSTTSQSQKAIKVITMIPMACTTDRGKGCRQLGIFKTHDFSSNSKTTTQIVVSFLVAKDGTFTMSEREAGSFFKGHSETFGKVAVNDW